MDKLLEKRDQTIIGCVKQSYFIHRSRTWPENDETNQLLAKYIGACEGIPTEKIPALFSEFDSETNIPKPYQIRNKFFQYEETRKREEEQAKHWNESEETMREVLERGAKSSHSKEMTHLIANIHSYRNEDKTLDQDKYYGELKRISDKYGVACPSVDAMKLSHIGRHK